MGTPPTLTPEPSFQPPPPNWWSRNWKWFVPVGCLTLVALFAGFVGAIMFFAFSMMKNSDVTQLALAKARGNAQVQQRLGTPIEPGWFVSGSINQAGSSGKADLTIPVSGPRGSATIYADATRFAGEWSFNRLEVAFKDDPNRIDLLPPTEQEH
jgi:hypothetical protein